MPPAYDIAAKLPTYEEAEMTKHSDSRVSQLMNFDQIFYYIFLLKKATIITKKLFKVNKELITWRNVSPAVDVLKEEHNLNVKGSYFIF